MFWYKKQLDRIERKQGEIMSAIDDLKKAVSDIADAIAAAVTKLNTPNATDAEVEAAAQQLETLVASLRAAVTPVPAA